ncbi:hypothetical protein EI983_02355 [Roseovarius faecimaris]|uniref:Peptide methionine sulfoxide reductase n=1 Tax=Roseovarius faecimaris TaxID=2494550 RepID=A0A6I6ILL0_9RHOB|nr:hypothetical protein [Roseovarius faecimaris]QGX97182.1 hypothetical protein EI983_02355 [Roseovarius faecimaris]
MTTAFLAAFDALPLGSFTGSCAGRRYVVTRSDFSGGAAQKLVAEELGGADYISLNLYRLASGARLKPCEMPEAKVVDFVLNLRAD